MTRRTQWVKPKVLGSFECASLAVPPTGLESIVKCSNCLKAAEVNCNQCEESYCKNCYESLHCKGARRKHHLQKIPHCSYCKFQVACKNCLTCVLQRPAAGSIQATMKESARGLYCDACFVHHHDAIEKHLEDNADRKLAERQLLRSKDAYLVSLLGLSCLVCQQHCKLYPYWVCPIMRVSVCLFFLRFLHSILTMMKFLSCYFLQVGQLLRQRMDTTHRFDNLMQSCEECLWRCGSWRCVTCCQIYCHTCLTALHSIGGPFGLHTG